MTILLAWFVVGAGAIVVAGTFLARAADVIAARTKLGGVWVGSILVATATSLPEIGTDVSAVLRGAVDLAVGDLFGSSMANMLILGVVALVPAGRDVFRRAALDHALFASLATIMTAIAAMAIMVRMEAALWRVGVVSIVLAALYLIASRLIARHTAIARVAEQVIEMTPAADLAQAHAEAMPLRRASVTFGVAALAILTITPWFAGVAHRLADATGIGQTVVGTSLVGLTTSLPELVTSLTAVRLGAFDLAVGNLFGSNAFNMAMFGALDLASSRGPVLAIAEQGHVISACVAIALMGMALAALVYRPARPGRLNIPMSLLLVAGYLAGVALMILGVG